MSHHPTLQHRNRVRYLFCPDPNLTVQYPSRLDTVDLRLLVWHLKSSSTFGVFGQGVPCNWVTVWSPRKDREVSSVRVSLEGVEGSLLFPLRTFTKLFTLTMEFYSVEMNFLEPCPPSNYAVHIKGRRTPILPRVSRFPIITDGYCFMSSLCFLFPDVKGLVNLHPPLVLKIYTVLLDCRERVGVNFLCFLVLSNHF